ncbi:phage recombination protein Bet [Caldicellulosiruptoraceae bacterium PP1]
MSELAVRNNNAELLEGEIEYETETGRIKLSPEIIKKYLVSGDPAKVTNEEAIMFLKLCQHQRLNPFLREAYLIKYSDKEPATIVVGKETFTKRAAKCELCAGWQAGVIVRKKNSRKVDEIRQQLFEKTKAIETNEKGKMQLIELINYVFELLKEPKLEYRVGTLVLPDEELVGGWAKVYRKDWQVPSEVSVSLQEYIRRNKEGQPTRSWREMPATMIKKVALVQALREAFPEQFQGMYAPEEMPMDSTQLPYEPINDIVNTEQQNETKSPLQKLIDEAKEEIQQEKKPDVKVLKEEIIIENVLVTNSSLHLNKKTGKDYMKVSITTMDGELITAFTNEQSHFEILKKGFVIKKMVCEKINNALVILSIEE